MDDEQTEQSSLSFRDFPANRNEGIRRKLYKPSYDLQFDLEMARRTSGTENDNHQSHENTETEPIKSEPIEFGLTNPHPGIDEETLEQLSIPPPLKYQIGFERELRPSAIFIYNRSIALLKTNQIISHILHLLAGRKTVFKHLEWIDDFSCVLAFGSGPDAIEAYTGLLVKPDEVEGDNGIPEAFDYLSTLDSSPEVYAAAYEFLCTNRPAKPFSESLFEANPKNKFNVPKRPEQLIPFIRFATTSDVKNSRARTESMFYALNGLGAGQEDVSSVTTGKIAKKQQRTKTSHGRRMYPDPPDPISTQPVDQLRPVKPLPKSAAKAKRSARPSIGILDDELARFMTKSIAVKPSSDRTPRKRERDEEENDEEDDGQQEQENEQREVEDQLKPNRKRRMPSPSAIKPSVELLPDRPETCGGNLRDEIFSAKSITSNSKMISDFPDLKPKLRITDTKDEEDYETAYQRVGEEEVEEEGLSMNTEEQKVKDNPSTQLALLPEDGSNSEEKDRFNSEYHREEMIDIINEDPTPPSPPRVPKPEPKSKGRWGPLFSRLL
ncbi:hypothetical protein Pst134EA_005483 [Puccinia striiformis f. sp. tritici]|uniref:hypothetical protein n=1 Tax=Puccinia striiformis f. sp. tritici TaxID=168172 RepID=UPI002008598D|nr:hypothetical protein Pst134EA_005483 [Puccinia striiformis f. sp. tritici]KAH9471590.1 hypothetical protein Pst134EA_005483 [Puccinia striiformis f. sp. tritici]